MCGQKERRNGYEMHETNNSAGMEEVACPRSHSAVSVLPGGGLDISGVVRAREQGAVLRLT